MSVSVISFSPQGEGHCLYTEVIDLPSIGSLEIRRASTIEFNNEKQRWEVKSLKGRVFFFSKARTLCLTWEKENFDRVGV
jgi:hypothetical protein